MKIAVIGGDERMLVAARLFRENGFRCETAALGSGSEEIKAALCGAAAAVLPLPCEKGGMLNCPMSNDKINIGDIFAAGEAHTLFIGGKLPIKSDTFADYAENEEFLLLNAAATAEAALMLALKESRKSLFDSQILVIGYGRIGKALVRLLNAFGADITLAARRSENRLSARLAGAKAVATSELYTAIKRADIIFNTVPETLLTEHELSNMQSEGFIIDLASGNGGCDKRFAENAGIKLIHALALPGKHFPETAGRAVYNAALSILCERGLSV